MRVVAGSVLIRQGFTNMSPISLLGALAGVLLLAGLWTPVGGTVAAIVQAWNSFSQPVDPLAFVLLGTLGAALAMIGPGTWSVDARLFGWKRIEIRERKK